MTRVSSDPELMMLKTWFRNYGKIVAVPIVVILVILLGLYIWQHQKVQKIERASQLYDQVQLAVQANQNPSPAIIDDLKQHYHNTPYPAFALLLRTTYWTKQNNFNNALADLQWVIDHAPLPALRQIARINAAKIKSFQKQPQQALQFLSVIDDAAYKPMIDALKDSIKGHAS